jgi:two-component system, sensor histidine kinase and response regulator
MFTQQNRSIWRAVAQCVTGIIALVLITLVCFQLRLHEATATCLYLLAVVLLSLQGNFFVSAIVSFIAVGCLDYFFVPPIFSFSVTDPSDAVASIAFLTASGVITQLISRMRKLMQEKLQQSEAYLSEAQRLSHTGSFGWRISSDELLTGQLLWSEETYRIFQCDAGTKPTMGFVLDRTHPEDAAHVKQIIERALANREDFDLEHRLLMPDGSIKHLHVVGHVRWDKSAQLEFVGAVMDVTIAKKAEEKLRESERRYVVTLSSIGDAVIATDDRARVTFMNRAAELLTAWTSADAIGRPIAEVFHIINEETRAVVEDPAAKVLRLGTVVGLANHTALLARDGREVPIDDCGSPIIEDDGKITGVVLVFRDMTQRRRAEEAELLRRSKERLELAVHGSNLSIWEFDMPDGRIENSRSTLINFWELLGYDPVTAPTDFDAVISLLVHPEDLERVRSAVQGFLGGEGREFEAEYRVRHKDGSDRWRLTRGVAVRNPQQKPVQFIGSFVDITELKQAGEALRKSEQRFRTFVDHATDAFFLFDDRNVVLDVNRQACQSLGYPREELLGITPHDFDPDMTPAILNEIERKLADGQLMAFESRHRRKDGTTFPVEVRGQTFWEGGRRFTVASARDITERKLSEEALRESEERFRGTFENAAVGITHCDVHGRYLRVNQKYCEIAGYSREDLLSRNFNDLTHREDLAATRDKFIPLTRGDISSYSLEKRLVHKDGSSAWINVFCSAQKNAMGEPVHFISIVQDVSERKRLEQELRESEHRWRSITEALPQLVWTATPDGACDYFSTQWTQYTGAPAIELLGWQWLQTLHPDDREPTRQFWSDSVAGRHVYDIEYRVRRFDGEYRWFKTRGVPIRDSDGRIFKWFGSCTDITDGKRAADELRLAKEAAESANRAKDEFLANVSHEIRTPMNAIMGLTSLVMGTNLNEGQRQSLATVKSAANNLLGIINDLLDFSKIEAGKLELDLGEFSLRAALGDTLRALAVRAHQKGLELASNVHSDVPDALIGDAGRLRQVLLNLIGNAIKFTENGEVVVQVSPDANAASKSDQVHLLFTVRDTGIGIPVEKQATIFRAFEQEDSSTTRKYGGTGLGLTISAQLAGLMGGKIEVESEPGEGSTFSFTARFGRSAGVAEAGAGESSDLLENLRVLIVDDNVANRQILEEWLRTWRMRPMAVGDGAAAVNALRQAVEAGAPYSLVLLDGRMPDADGLTVALQIRHHVDISSTRIILLPSEDSSIDIARSREMGISAYLLKPVQQSELLETIGRVMGRTTSDPALAKMAASTPESKELSSPATRLQILVAEDNEFNVILLKQLFDRRGHGAHITGNGREAVELATGGAFDLLLLDIHMPEMDGFAVARAIREQERASGNHLPIIAFTARTGKADRERCIAAGMDDFLSKPVQADALWEVIDRVVAARTAVDDHDLGLLDPRTLLGACGGEQAILESICRTIQTSVPNQMARVRSAMNDKDAPRLRDAAHLLRGTLSAFSTVAGTAAAKIEDAAALGQTEQTAPMVARVESICSELVEQVRGLSIEKLRSSGKV